VTLAGVATSGSVSAQSVARKFGFGFAATDPAEVLSDEAVTAVFVATRHDSHARYVVEALGRGKHVFVEKPLAVTREQLDEVRAAAEAASAEGSYLAVGFNRRFSPPFRDIAEFFADRREPLAVTYRMNAGRLPRSSWIQAEGQGGRIVGEGCHVVDVFTALTGARPVRVVAAATETANLEIVGEDTVSVVVAYDDGSIATLHYVANGADGLAKEYCEVSAGGRTAVMDDFRAVTFYDGRSGKRRRYKGGKGHAEEVAHFLDVVRGQAEPAFTVESLVDTTAVTFAAVEAIRTRAAVDAHPGQAPAGDRDAT
jgi:polar amino acid transport system substrate-binding protein